MRRSVPIAIVLALSVPLQAQTVTAGFTVDAYGGGLAGGTAMAFTPDGRLLGGPQRGVVQIMQNGALRSAPFHTASSVDSPLGGERGLPGIVVDPDFSSNGYVSIQVTTVGASAPHHEVRRLTASPPSADVSDGSKPAIVVLEDLGSSTSHSGGGSTGVGSPSGDTGGSTGTGPGSSGSSSRCGALGLEALILLFLRAVRRWN